MKNSKTTFLIILIVLAVILAAVSVFAFVYAGISTAATSPSTTTGYYPNGMMGSDWSGMSGMMGGNWNPSSTVQTSATTQNTVLPLIGFASLDRSCLNWRGWSGVFTLSSQNRIS